MSKTSRPYKPDQILLLPPSMKDWLPTGHLSHFISELVDESLDLSAITKVYERAERGYPPYHPVMMRLPAILVARPEEGQGRMVADLHDPQPSQVVAQCGLTSRLTAPKV